MDVCVAQRKGVANLAAAGIKILTSLAKAKGQPAARSASPSAHSTAPAPLTHSKTMQGTVQRKRAYYTPHQVEAMGRAVPKMDISTSSTPAPSPVGSTSHSAPVPAPAPSAPAPSSSSSSTLSSSPPSDKRVSVRMRDFKPTDASDALIVTKEDRAKELIRCVICVRKRVRVWFCGEFCFQTRSLTSCPSSPSGPDMDPPPRMSTQIGRDKSQTKRVGKAKEECAIA